MSPSRLPAGTDQIGEDVVISAAPTTLEPLVAARPRRPAGGSRFDWLMVALCAWPLGGAYLDAWAHNHIRLETFFTPWHAVLYSGFLAYTVGLLAVLVTNRRRGYAWRRALPQGYGLSLLGIGLLAVGGPGDMLWHLAFGIELRLDAALSPTHLLLAGAIGLIVSGPLRAAWHQRTGTFGGWMDQLPLLLSLTFTLSLFTLITQFAHPFVRPYAAISHETLNPEYGQTLGVLSIVMQTGLLMGTVLLAMRRWRLVPGAVTLVFTLNAALLSLMQYQFQFILVALAAGVVADLLAWWLRPSATHPEALRLFAFAVPVVLYLLYFAALMLTGGIWWTIHFWMGATVLAGVTGWLLSYLVVPPASPAAA